MKKYNIEYDYIANDYIVDQNGQKVEFDIGFPDPGDLGLPFDNKISYEVDTEVLLEDLEV